MAKRLRKLTGRKLRFIDEEGRGTLGTLMYTETFFKGELRNYFFVPYDKMPPFRISSRGPNKVCVSKDHTEIYGHLKDYNRVANVKELESLAQFEGFLRVCNPLAEIHGRSGPSLISPLISSEKKPAFTCFSYGFDIGNR